MRFTAIIVLVFIAMVLLVPTSAGQFKGYQSFEVDHGPENGRPVDLDGDGDLDLVLICNGDLMTDAQSIQRLINDGKGNFKIESEAMDDHPYDLQYTDMDADGDLDKVLYDNVSGKVYINDGSGNYNLDWEEDIGGIFVGKIYILDLNGDNKKDIAYFDAIGNLDLYIFKSRGNYEQSYVDIVVADRLIWFDLDSDGDLDLFLTKGGMKIFGEIVDDPEIEVYTNDGSGTFELTYNMTPTSFIGDATIGIIDKKIIVCIEDRDNNWIDIYQWQNSNLRSIATIRHGFEDDEIKQLELADIDGDGNSDLVTLHQIGYSYTVIRTYPNVLSVPESFEDMEVTYSTTDFCTFDANGDGKLDIAGWEGFDFFMAGDTAWISIQGRTTYESNDDSDNGGSSGTSDIGSNNLFCIVIITIIVILVLTAIIIRRKEKQDEIQAQVPYPVGQQTVPYQTTAQASGQQPPAQQPYYPQGGQPQQPHQPYQYQQPSPQYDQTQPQQPPAQPYQYQQQPQQQQPAQPDQVRRPPPPQY